MYVGMDMVCIFHPVYPYECLSMAAATERNILEKKNRLSLLVKYFFIDVFSFGESKAMFIESF